MKREIIILVISVIILIMMIFIIKPNSKNSNMNLPQKITDEDVQYDEDTSLYYIVDEETGEIINASEDLESLEIYKIDPDYDPNPQIEKKSSLEDYIEIEEFVESED